MLLLVKSDQAGNAYGRYAGEILRAEGLNWYRIEEAAGLRAAALSQYELVILTHCVLDPAEIRALLAYVEGGGRLAAFRPSLRLGQALGLQPTYAAQKGGTIRIGRRHPAGHGMCHEDIQIHGMADHWTLPEGSKLSVAAHLGEQRGESSDRPALVVGSLGKGRVAAWTYDVPAVVAAIRQGDPERANTNSAALDGIYRPSELFVGHLDPECAQIPQADVHTALLANVIEWLLDRPAPRLWYYPKPGQRSVLIMTSDDDWSKLDEFDQLIAATERRDGRIEFYLVPGTRVTEELAADWAARGHAISVHPDFAAVPGHSAGLRENGLDEQVLHEREMLTASVRAVEERFGVKVRTVRHHAARWSGYLDAARILEDLGVGMDLNYVSIWPFSATCMIGSGRPMKFVDLDGALMDVFQQSTLYSEDVVVEPTFIFSLKWPTERALAHAQGFLDGSVARYYTPVGLNSHPVSFASYSAPFVEGIFDMARERGMPIITASAWLDFTLARYEAELADIVWDGASLRFTLHVAGQPAELTVMCPLGDREVIRATVDGADRPAAIDTLWGRQYALLKLERPVGALSCQVDFRPAE